MKKFLILIFILLIVVILSELVYLVYISKTSLSYTQKIEANKAIFIETRNNTSDVYKNLKAEPAVHPKIIEQLKNYLKSPESRLYIVSEQTTTVLDIAKDGACVEDRRSGVVYPGQICFPFAIKLKNDVLPEGYVWTYFTENLVKKAQVYTKKDGELKKSDLKKIAINDTITTTEKWDPSVGIDLNKLKDSLDQQVVDFTLYIIK